MTHQRTDDDGTWICDCSLTHDHDHDETPDEDLCHCSAVLDRTGRCWYCDGAAGRIWAGGQP